MLSVAYMRIISYYELEILVMFGQNSQEKQQLQDKIQLL